MDRDVQLNTPRRTSLWRRKMLRLGWLGFIGAGIAAVQHVGRGAAPVPADDLSTAATASVADTPARLAPPDPRTVLLIDPSPVQPTGTSVTPSAVPATPTPLAIDSCPTWPAGRVPRRPEIVGRTAWGAEPATRAYLPQQPRLITLHHEGVYFDGSMSAPDYLRHVQVWSIKHRHWPDIPYHFLLDLNGTIYEARPPEARGDTNTSYNLQDHVLIALLGKYDQGEQQPNERQIRSVIELMAWIAGTYAISPDQIHGHRDFIPTNERGEHIDPVTREPITCPGDNLYHYLANGTLQRGVAERVQQTPRLGC
jgi:hypothetical protein